MKHLIFILSLVVNCSGTLLAQSKKIHTNEKPVSAIQERVIISTDRTVYFSGELIFFKANRILSGFNNDTLFSNVLYLELYDKNDKPIVQKKEQIVDGTAYGDIEIPADIVTGNYCIRAYTQYMKNFKHELFYTNQIEIINPELPAKEVIKTIKNERDSLLTNPDSEFDIITSKEIFSPRSLIVINLKGKANADLSVSVVKKGSYEEGMTGINNNLYIADNRDSVAVTKWYPEIRSVSISGKVIDKKTEKPLKGVLVYMSIVDNGKQFHVARTKGDGGFIFSLPNLNESHKIYICVQKQENKETIILINSDFSPDFAKFEWVQENIDSSKINLINEMYINFQVAKAFANNMEIKKSFLDTLRDPFSEKYEYTLLKDYVDLPEMTDIFNEIVPYTHVKKNGKTASIQVFDKMTKTIFPQPLILLDGIPYQDDSALLSLSPSKIVSVGTIAQPFVHGSETINGIINIRSADGNLAGLKLSKDLVVIDYVTLGPLTSQQYKNYRKEAGPESRNPDFRNTLYWNPSVILNNGSATIEFYSSDYTSDYDIIVRGVDEKGELLFKNKTIKIDNPKQ